MIYIDAYGHGQLVIHLHMYKPIYVLDSLNYKYITV